jgi:hypothetical protein
VASYGDGWVEVKNRSNVFYIFVIVVDGRSTGSRLMDAKMALNGKGPQSRSLGPYSPPTVSYG